MFRVEKVSTQREIAECQYEFNSRAGCPDLNAPKVWKIGGAVKPPQPIHTPNPKYTELAKKSELQGTVVLYVVLNTEGISTKLAIARPLGLGLDDEACKAVSGWKFKPATKDGVAVASQINVEVNFSLY